MNKNYLEIISYEPRYRSSFKILNVAWLEKFFHVEPIDEEVLSNPENILLEGGHIFFARYQDTIIGTCALLKTEPTKFELSKMAVDEKFHGLGVGRQLLETAIRHYRTYPGCTLFLETNSLLKPAIALYESVGFSHGPRPLGPSHYVRANVYMAYMRTD